MSTYSGSWNSTQYPTGFVHGDAYVRLSGDRTMGTFMLIYNGTYRHSDQSVIQVSIGGTSGSATQRVFTFKGQMQNQQISFDATVFTEEEISGTYTTSNPSDNGVFSVKKSDFNIAFEDKVNSQACIIL